MKLSEMERHIGAQIGFHPLRQTAEFSVAVVERGYNQVHDLGPFAHLAQRHKCVKHRLQLPRDHFAVVGLGESFEIDLDRVHFSVGCLKRLLLYIAVGDNDAAYAGYMAGIGCIHQEFAENHWLDVGVGDGRTVVSSGKFGNVLWRNVLGWNLLRPRLGNVPVLAELAVDIAARCGKREGYRSWGIMKQRLRLDGIDVRCTYARMHQRVVGSCAILAHTAVAAFTIAHYTFAWTQLAFDLFVLELLIELRFDCELRIILILRASRKRRRGGRRPKSTNAHSRSRRQCAH